MPKSTKKNSPLTFLQIGLGSMGKRRIRNLLAAGEKNIIGLDFSPERRAEAEKLFGIRTVDALAKLSPGEFDALLISTPPDKHGDYIRFALKHHKHFYTEVATTDDGYAEIFSAKKGLVMAPSSTFLHFLPVKMMKELVERGKIGQPLVFQYHVGQYLPTFHPWEDYRKIYISKKETGSCRTLFLFEFVWLNRLVGSTLADISGYTGKVSDLEITADDVLSASVVYKNNARGNILIELLSRKPVRYLYLVGSEGVLEWDWLGSVIRITDADGKTEIMQVSKGNPANGYLAAEEMYDAEIKAFVDAIRGGAPYPFTFKEDLENMKMLWELEREA